MSVHNTEFRRRAVAVLQAMVDGACEMPRIRQLVDATPVNLHSTMSFLRRLNIVDTERKATGGKAARYRLLMTQGEALDLIVPTKMEMDYSALDEHMPMPDCVRETLAAKGRARVVMGMSGGEV